MACVTLKRRLEWVDPSMNAETSGSTSPKAMMIDSVAARSPKRIRMQPMMSTSSSSSAHAANSSSSSTSSSSPSTNSLFKPFTSHDLRAKIACELSSAAAASAAAAASSVSSSSSTSNIVAALSGASGDHISHDSENRPLFSFNQVVMIVERLLREKESDIRQEYDRVLVNRLAEQYEQFVKFTHDQIQRNFDSHSTPSYLS